MADLRVLRSWLVAAACAAAVLASPALAEGDVAKGEKQYKKCKTCHALEDGKNKIGPHLIGLFGREAGTVEGFKYSKALKESGIVWDDEILDAYIKKPKEVVPDGKMVFAGIKKDQRRLDLIAYLKEATQPQ